MSVDAGVWYAHPDGNLRTPKGELGPPWGTGAGGAFEYGVTRPTRANTWFHEGANLAQVLTPRGPNNGTEYRITSPGIYENLDVTAHVVINAPSATAANPVIFRRNRVRGVAGTGGVFIYVLNASEKGAVIVEQNLIDPDDRTIINDGIRSGGNAVIRRNAIYGIVDGIVLVFGGNQVWGNLVREHVRLPQASQPDGFTHNDSCQVMGGDDHDIFGNDFGDATNAAVYAQNENVGTYGAITNLRVRSNWLDNGAACLHVRPKSSIDNSMIGEFIDNIFGPDAGNGSGREVYIANQVTATISGNVKSTGGAATVTRYTA